MSLSFQLKIVGASLLLLAGAHAFFPRRLNWKEELGRVSSLNRQVFQIHCFFIGLILFLFGLLSLCFAVGLHRVLRSGRGSIWGPLLLSLFGLGLIVAGLFVTAWSVPEARAFSLLGPYEAWMVPQTGFAQPGDIGGPMNLGQEYRWNVPVLAYAFDQSFLDYFGSNGVAAVESAIGILNSLPPVHNKVPGPFGASEKPTAPYFKTVAP